MAKGYKRRQFLINPKFQLRITGYFLILAIVNIGIFYGCVRYFFNMFIQKGIDIGLPKKHVFFMFMDDQMYSMNWVFFVTALITLVLLLVSGVLISHKVAGPLFRLNNHFKKIASGNDLTKLNFRDGDFFPEVAESFNEIVDQKSAKK